MELFLYDKLKELEARQMQLEQAFTQLVEELKAKKR